MNDSQYQIVLLLIIQLRTRFHQTRWITTNTLALGVMGMTQRAGRVEVVELLVQARIVKVDLLHRLQIIKVIWLLMEYPLEPYKYIYLKNWIHEVRHL